MKVGHQGPSGQIDTRPPRIIIIIIIGRNVGEGHFHNAQGKARHVTPTPRIMEIPLPGWKKKKRKSRGKSRGCSGRSGTPRSVALGRQRRRRCREGSRGGGGGKGYNGGQNNHLWVAEDVRGREEDFCDERSGWLVRRWVRGASNAPVGYVMYVEKTGNIPVPQPCWARTGSRWSPSMRLLLQVR
jgi:hypothetical protein